MRIRQTIKKRVLLHDDGMLCYYICSLSRIYSY